MGEPEDTPVDPTVAARRGAMADRIEQRLKWLFPFSLVSGLLMVALGVSDLAAGWLETGWRLDVAIIIVGAAGVYSPFSLRRTAGRLRAVYTPRRATRSQIARAVGSMLLSELFVFGIGYLLGGWLLGLVVATTTVVFTAAVFLWALTKARRKQRAVSHDSI